MFELRNQYCPFGGVAFVHWQKHHLDSKSFSNRASICAETICVYAYAAAYGDSVYVNDLSYRKQCDLTRNVRTNGALPLQPYRYTMFLVIRGMIGFGLRIQNSLLPPLHLLPGGISVPQPNDLELLDLINTYEEPLWAHSSKTHQCRL
jgi:hypothetical protein